MGASSSAPATVFSSSFAAWSTRFAARSKCRSASSSATPACRRTAASSSRIGIHLGDVVEESDGDLMGDGVNIAARLEGVCYAGRDLSVRGRLSSGERQAGYGGRRSRSYLLKNIDRPDPGLFVAGRRPRAVKAGETGGAGDARSAAVHISGHVVTVGCHRRCAGGAA